MPTRSDMVCGLKGQRSRSQTQGQLHSDSSFQTAIALHSHSLGGDTDESNSLYGVGSNSVSKLHSSFF